jgi:hypothetical protein
MRAIVTTLFVSSQACVHAIARASKRLALSFLRREFSSAAQGEFAFA